MSRKIISLLAVAVMVFASFAIVMADGTEAESSAPQKIHPIPGYNMPWVTTVPILQHVALYNEYFLDDPYDAVTSYLNGDITLDILRTMCRHQSSYPSDQSYYSVSIQSDGGASIYYNHVESFEVFESFNLYFADNPHDRIVSYINGEITRSQFEDGSSSSDMGGYYHAEYQAWNNSVSVQGPENENIPLDGTSYWYFSDTLYFLQYPRNEVLRFVNKEITLDELKTKCDYTESSARDFSLSYFEVRFENGKIMFQYYNNRYISSQIPYLNPEACFTEDPYAEVYKYVNGEIELDELKTKCGYVRPNDRVGGNSYYCVSISGEGANNGSPETASILRYITISPNYIFLDKGKYHISITSEDLDVISIGSLNGSRYDGISIKEGSGSGDITVTAQDAIWFTGYSNKGGGYGTIDNTWREKTLTYTMDPAPTSGEKRTDFDRTVSILSDREWVRLTSVNRITGEYTCESSFIMFVSGSNEEKEFLADVVEKGLVDGSGYGSRTLKLASDKVSLYACRESSSYMPTGFYMTPKATTEVPYPNSVKFECKAEKLSVSDVKPFKFYANYDFTIAVKYDTAKVKAVVMMYPSGFGGTSYSVLESGRVYDFHMVSSAEYELYAIPVLSSTASLAPTEVEIYTSNVATPDSNGTVFAAIAIALCVLAFGTLFLAGRRPKWGDLEGLPSADTEVVHHEVPADVPEENIPEEVPAEGQPKE